MPAEGVPGLTGSCGKHSDHLTAVVQHDGGLGRGTRGGGHDVDRLRFCYDFSFLSFLACKGRATGKDGGGDEKRENRFHWIIKLEGYGWVGC